MSDPKRDKNQIDIVVSDEVTATTEKKTPEQREEELIAYLQSEITAVDSGEERSAWLEQLKKIRRQREARPEVTTKTYPWDGASNLCVPLAMTDTNAIAALLQMNFANRAPLWTVESSTYPAAAKALTNLLDIMAKSKQHLAMRKVNSQLLYSLTSEGTQFCEVPWIEDRWRFKRAGGEQVDVIAKNCPAIIPVPLEDLYTRVLWTDVNKAKWVAIKYRFLEHELLQKQADGTFQNVQAVLTGGPETSEDDLQADASERAGLAPQVTKSEPYDIFKVYIYDDVDDDGIPEDRILWFHNDTGTILRSEFNDLGVRPIGRLTYIDRPNQLYGMGVGWIDEHLQDEIDTLHNMRIDGTHLSMLQMYISKRGGGLPAGFEFRPLAHIQVDDPRTDFILTKFPDLGSGTIAAEQIVREISSRATGMGDAMLGFPMMQAPSRTTASGTMFMARQGGQLVQATMARIEEDYSNLAQLLVFQMVRNPDKTQELIQLLSPEEQTAIQPLLQMKTEQIPTQFTFRVATTDPQQTEEARRQALLTKTQLYSMYTEKAIQYGMMLANPQIPPMVKETVMKLYLGTTKLMEETLASFGEHDAKSFLPYMKDIAMMTEAIEAMKDQQLGGSSVRENRGYIPSDTRTGPGGPGLGDGSQLAGTGSVPAGSPTGL